MDIDEEPIIIESEAGPSSSSNVVTKEKSKKKNLPW